jgi:hypothetical protein
MNIEVMWPEYGIFIPFCFLKLQLLKMYLHDALTAGYILRSGKEGVYHHTFKRTSRQGDELNLPLIGSGNLS